MMKHAPEWVRTQWSEVQDKTSGLLHPPVCNTAVCNVLCISPLLILSIFAKRSHISTVIGIFPLHHQVSHHAITFCKVSKYSHITSAHFHQLIPDKPSPYILYTITEDLDISSRLTLKRLPVTRPLSDQTLATWLLLPLQRNHMWNMNQQRFVLFTVFVLYVSDMESYSFRYK